MFLQDIGQLTEKLSGVGSLFWLPFIYFWGRAPVLFWTTILGTAFTIGSAVAPDFTTYYAMRGLTGFTLTSCVAIGLAFLQDIFFFHEHARKIGIWAAMFLLAPYLGALLGNFMIGATGIWRPVLWMCVGLDLFTLVLIVLFGDETYYNRAIPIRDQPPRGSRMMRLIGVWQIRNHDYFWTVRGGCARLVKVFMKPIVPLIMIF
jgi:MFS family permease